jgi:Macrocin-O-methyltransferase (TylF)
MASIKEELLSAWEAAPIATGKGVLNRPRDIFLNYKKISLHTAMEFVELDGDFLELGVYRGWSAHFLESYCGDRKLFLFDSFDGLPADWFPPFLKGFFALPEEEIPRFNSANTLLIKGLFQDTLPNFVREYEGELALIHVDCDLYESTLFALQTLHKLITPGTLILFDEFIVKKGEWANTEELDAFGEYLSINNRSYKLLFRTEWSQCLIKILD